MRRVLSRGDERSKTLVKQPVGSKSAAASIVNWAGIGPDGAQKRKTATAELDTAVGGIRQWSRTMLQSEIETALQDRIGDTLHDGNGTRVAVVNALTTVNPDTEAIVRAVDYRIVSSSGPVPHHDRPGPPARHVLNYPTIPHAAGMAGNPTDGPAPLGRPFPSRKTA